MKLMVFSIYDEKALIFATPFFMSTNGQAIRGFMDLAKDPNSFVSKHPSDYKLYQLGEYDDLTGVFTNVNAPIFLASGSEILDPVV